MQPVTDHLKGGICRLQVSVPPGRQPAADALDMVLEELADYLRRKPRPDTAFTHVYEAAMRFALVGLWDDAPLPYPKGS